MTVLNVSKNSISSETHMIYLKRVLGEFNYRLKAIPTKGGKPVREVKKAIVIGG